MQVVLLVAGIVAIGVGAATLLASVVNGTFDPGHPLITAGTIAGTGGFILLGLASVVMRLRRIAEALDNQPLPKSIAGAAEPQPAPAQTVPPSAAESGATSQQADAGKEPASDAAKVASPVSTPAAAPVETQRPPARSEPVLVAGAPMIPPAAAGSHEDLASAKPPLEWPRVQGDRSPPVEVAVDAPETPLVPRKEVIPEPRTAIEAHDSRASNEPPPRVLKSGVIEGMAYTLYSDGSVEAELPQGNRRFASIAEWRAHMRDQT